MHWSSSCGRITLQITKAQAAQGSHQGQCDGDIEALRNIPAIRRQLNKLNQTDVVKVLEMFGAWDDQDLADHDDNLNRLLWIACGDIVEGNN
jgi:hypothetical protein